jgi:hypothetical protein
MDTNDSHTNSDTQVEPDSGAVKPPHLNAEQTTQEVQIKEVVGSKMKEVFADLFKNAVLGILGILAAVLFFPFQWQTSLPAVFFLIAGLAVVIVGMRRQLRVRQMVMTGLALVLLSFAWGIFGIFLVSGKSIYCLASDDSNPFSGELVRVGSSNTYVFLISDPVRKSRVVRYVVSHLRYSLNYLDPRTNGPKKVLLLPLRTAIRHAVPGASMNSSVHELVVSYFGPSLTIDYKKGVGDSPENQPSVTIAAAQVHMSIVDCLQGGTSGMAPWEEVEIPDKMTLLNSATYVAATDAGIEAASLGDFETAFDNLESAYPLAPGNVEKARNRILASRLSRGLLYGNVGEIQALAYAKQGLSDWRIAIADADIASKHFSTEVDHWLYLDFKNFLDDRIAGEEGLGRLFGTTELPQKLRIQSTLANGIKWTEYQVSDQPITTLLSSQVDTVLEASRNITNCSELKNKLHQQFGNGQEVDRWLWETIMREEVDEARAYRPLKCITANLKEPWKSSYDQKLDSMHEYMSAVASNNQEAVLKLIPSMAKSAGFLQFSEVFERLIARGKHKADDSRLSDGNLLPPPNTHWWSRSFLDAYAAGMFTLLDEITGCLNTSCVSNSKCENKLAEFSGLYERDQAGKGVLFAPTAALSVLLSRLLNSQASASAQTDYRESLLGDPLNVFKPYGEVRISEILVSTEHMPIGEAKSKAGGILSRLRHGEEFGDLAKQYSDTYAPSNNEDVGYFARGRLAKSLDDLLFATPVCGITDVVQTKQGFGVYLITDKR